MQDIKFSKKQGSYLGIAYILLIMITALANYWYMIHVGWSSTVDTSQGDYGRYFYDTLSMTVIPMSLIVFPVLLHIEEITAVFNGQIIKKVILALSTTSFGVYLIHPFILYYVNKFIFNGTLSLPGPIIIWFLVKVLIVYIISYCITLLMKFIPLLRQLFY